MCSSTDFDISDTKLLLDELYKVYNENDEGLNCSTCAELISKLNKHVLNTHGHGALQNIEAFQSAPTKSKHNLRSQKQINYSEQVEDSIPSRRLPKNLKTPCNVDVLSSTLTASTSTSNFSDVTNPEIKMEDLDVDMDYPEFGGSDVNETKIDINYLTGADVVCTTKVVPDNVTVFPSTTKKEKLAKSCPICKKKYLSTQKLKLHLQKLHPEEKSYTKPPKSASPCIICKKEFSTIKELNVHLRESHPGEKPYTCTQADCGKKFLNETQLKGHSKKHSEETYSCDVCGKNYPNKDSLRRHKSVHSKRFICDQCGKDFAKKIQLEVHKRGKHTKEKPFTCTICGKGFAGNDYLYIHMTNVHSDELKCTCEVCGKSYKTKNALNSHMIVHSGQKPFVCGICGKGFFYKNELEVHTTVHTGERAFACDICPKSFKEKRHFITHMRTHTGERPYLCQVCNKSFSSKRNLNAHLRSHTDARPYVCHACDKGFKSYTHIHRHRKVVHSSENLGVRSILA